jgi:hypothetical protein
MIMKLNPIDTLWLRAMAQLKAACKWAYRALSEDWLAKLRLKDHYKRSSAS